MTKDEAWLLKEKYGGEKSAPVFNESIDEIKNKYPWGAGFFTDCERLTAGEPLGFVIGFVPFLDCKIWLDSHPLIPRPETEFWVEQAIRTITETTGEYRTTLSTDPDPTEGSPRDFPRATLGEELPRVALGSNFKNFGSRELKGLQILDLCAGSGAIGVAVAKHAPVAHVDFAEIDVRHITTIEKNCLENGISPDRCRSITSDLFSNIEDRYDYILTNPPYIDPILNRTEASVTNYEPHLALYGGLSGLEIITRIIATAPKFLAPHGQLWLEHEPEQSMAISSLGATYGFNTTTHLDQYGVERYSILVLQ